MEQVKIKNNASLTFASEGQNEDEKKLILHLNRIAHHLLQE